MRKLAIFYFSFSYLVVFGQTPVTTDNALLQTFKKISDTLGQRLQDTIYTNVEVTARYTNDRRNFDSFLYKSLFTIIAENAQEDPGAIMTSLYVLLTINQSGK